MYKVQSFVWNIINGDFNDMLIPLPTSYRVKRRM